MNETDNTYDIKKTLELRTLSIFKQRVIPFLEEIYIFTNEIKPLLDEMNITIEEYLKSVPNSINQLSNDSKTSEYSTTNIIGVIDELSDNVNIISSNIKKIGTNTQKNNNHFKIVELIYDAIQKDKDIQYILSGDIVKNNYPLY